MNKRLSVFIGWAITGTAYAYFIGDDWYTSFVILTAIPAWELAVWIAPPRNF